MLFTGLNKYITFGIDISEEFFEYLDQEITKDFTSRFFIFP